ncbi:MAG: DUF2961 domain-containing protein [Planctomycetes bacterium]|nr:DUF2961 domain-containing protein [Planctomycetota bacterium]
MNGPLADLPRLKNVRSRRSSSYDTTGGNADNWTFEPGQTRTIAKMEGPGCIRHIWVTIGGREDFHLRKLVLRMYWDGEESPSVESPIGDFFGLGHATVTYFQSAPLQMFDRAFNCWFPMPYSEGARIDITNDGEKDAIVYFYVDYQEYDEPQEDMGRFHAHWRRQLVKQKKETMGPDRRGREARLNTTGKDNYLVLDAKGKGHYVGCHIDLDTNEPGWWGEGDDMIFVDGEKWPPNIHGTGMEDYFSGAWNYNKLARTFCTPYYGYHFRGNEDYTGKHSQYRYHIEDPIYFQKSIRVTIEHGHANDRSGDWTSVAYWYQTEPHKAFPKLADVEGRIPYKYGGREDMRAGKDRRELPVKH